MDSNDIEMQNFYDFPEVQASCFKLLNCNTKNELNTRVSKVEEAFMGVDILFCPSTQEKSSNSNRKKEDISKKLYNCLYKTDIMINFIKSFTEDSAFQVKPLIDNLEVHSDTVNNRKINYLKKAIEMKNAIDSYDSKITKLRASVAENRTIIKVIEEMRSMGFNFVNQDNSQSPKIKKLVFSHSTINLLSDSLKLDPILIEVKLKKLIVNDASETVSLLSFFNNAEIIFPYHNSISKSSTDIRVGIEIDKESQVFEISAIMDKSISKILEGLCPSLIRNQSEINGLLPKIIFVIKHLILKILFEEIKILKSNRQEEEPFQYKGAHYYLQLDKESFSISCKLHASISISLEVNLKPSEQLLANISEFSGFSEAKSSMLLQLCTSFINSILNISLTCKYQNYLKMSLANGTGNLKIKLDSEQTKSQLNQEKEADKQVLKLQNSVQPVQMIKFFDKLALPNCIHKLLFFITNLYLDRILTKHLMNSRGSLQPFIMSYSRKFNFLSNNSIESVTLVKPLCLLNKSHELRNKFELCITINSGYSHLNIETKQSSEINLYPQEKENSSDTQLKIQSLYYLETIVIRIKKKLESTI